MEAILKRYSKKDKVFIVGGGASLSDFDFSVLEGHKVIVVNHSYKHVPHFDLLCAIDFPFYEKEYERLKDMNVTACAIRGYYESDRMHNMGRTKIVFFRNGGLSGVDYRKGYVRIGANSGYFAIGVAISLGAKDIRLLGYDMKYDRDKPYFYGGKFPEFGLDHMIDRFRHMKEELRDDIKITNYSEISALDVFPKKSLKEVLL